jgi:hypothetical protein
VEELKRQMQPKRARTDDDAGDAHDLIAEFDNCDGLLMICQDSRFISGTPQQVLTTQVIRW